jgi:epoxide hydrolase-like predicted phosphatase
VSASPIEAVVWDYGGVISSPLFRGIGSFEADLGYPPGSLLELIFGLGSASQAPPPAATVGEAAVAAGERAYIDDGGGDPGDGAGAAESSVTHDWHRLEIGEITIVEYMAGISERAPAIIGQPLDFDAYRRFMRDIPVGVHWPVVHRIRELKRDGIRVALLTNNVKEFGEAWRSTFPVDELFEVVVDSSHVGMRKPDPRIYLLTCERIGVEPTASVFLDDNRDNVMAARAVGMEAVHFVTAGDDPLPPLVELDAILERRGTVAVR